jgi:NO-binding membrane sensor protein with MHYT domain
MAHLNHFSYGWLTPTLAYLFSYLGSLLGLKATARARMLPPGPARVRWLIIAAWAIGGTGIWVMHFIAMIGFSVAGTQVRFNLPITIASWLTAVIVVGIGLFIVGYGRPSTIKVLFGGLFMGLGVAAMHYTGMSAMQIDGMEHYNPKLVVASVLIAVVAATVALWFTVSVRRNAVIMVAAAIMGVAVCGMHYTGMVALSVQLNPIPGPVSGWDALGFLLPIFVFVLLVVITLGYAMLNSLSEADAAALRELEDRLGVRESDRLSSGFRVPQDRF